MGFYLVKAAAFTETGDSGQRIWVWDNSTTAQELTLEYETTIPIGPQPDGQRFSALYRDGVAGAREWFLEEYDLPSGTYLFDRPEYSVAMPQNTRWLHDLQIESLPAMHPDGIQHLLRGQAVSGGPVTLYRSTVAGYDTLATVDPAFAEGQSAISPDGSMVAVAAERLTTPAVTAPLRVFNWLTGAEADLGAWWLSAGEPSAPSMVLSVVWSPDSSMLAVMLKSSVDPQLGKLVVIYAATGELIAGPQSFSDGVYQFFGRCRGWTNGNRIAVALPGEYMPVGGNPNSGPVRIYHFDGGALVPVGNIDASRPDGFNLDVLPKWVAVIPGTELIAVQPFEAAHIKLWDMADGSLRATLTWENDLALSEATMLLTKPVQPPPPPVFWTSLIRSVEYP